MKNYNKHRGLSCYNLLIRPHRIKTWNLKMYWHKTPYWLKALYPGLSWHKSRNRKTLYLTFDDGPIPIVTEYVLEQLHQHDAKATFFCVGDNIAKHPHVFQKVIEQGHSIGNHTFNHIKGWQSKDEEYYQNIAQCQKIIDENYGRIQRPLLRPPYGKITRRQVRHLKKQYEVIMWDVLSGDFDTELAPETCLKRTIKATRNGSIVVFHDSFKAEKNLRYCLPRFLSHFKEKGYSFDVL